MTTELATTDPKDASKGPTDSEACIALNRIGARINSGAIESFNKLEGWSMQKAMIPVALEQSFKALGEIDFASQKGREMAEGGEDGETVLKGAGIVAIAAKVRLAAVKQIVELAGGPGTEKPRRVHSNLPPQPRVQINQQFVNGEPKPVVELASTAQQ